MEKVYWALSGVSTVFGTNLTGAASISTDGLALFEGGSPEAAVSSSSESSDAASSFSFEAGLSDFLAFFFSASRARCFASFFFLRFSAFLEFEIKFLQLEN